MGATIVPAASSAVTPPNYTNLIASGTISSSPNTKTISIPAGAVQGYSLSSSPVVFNGGALTNTFLGSNTGINSTTTSSVSTLNTYILPSITKTIDYGIGNFVAVFPILGANSTGSTLFLLTKPSATPNYYKLLYSTDYGLTWTAGDQGFSWAGSQANNQAIPVFDATLNKYAVMTSDASSAGAIMRYASTINGAWTNSNTITIGYLNAAVATGSGLICGIYGTQGAGTVYSVISTNGTSISANAMPSNYLVSLSVANGVLFAYSTSVSFPTYGQVYTSTDGVTWTLRTYGGIGGASVNGDIISYISYGQSNYIIGTTTGKVYTSTNLSSWTLQPNSYINPLYGSNRILYINGAWLSITSGTAAYGTVTTNSYADASSIQNTSYANTGGVYFPIGSINASGNVIYCSGDNSVVYLSGNLGNIVKISSATSTTAAIYSATTTTF